MVRVVNNTSATLILNTGAPQGCVLSPLLYSLFTHDCVAMHHSNTIIKFADETRVVGLITDNDETAYREVLRDLAVWCQDNNLSLNESKTGCITAWYGNCLASDRKALQRVVRTAQYITETKLPAIQDLCTRPCQRKAQKIVRLQSPKSQTVPSVTTRQAVP